MNDERIQILKMVQEGKVSAEEAARLLEALEQPESKSGKGRQKARSLRIVVTEGNRTQTITFNIAMVRWVMRIPGMIAFAMTDAAGRQFDPEALVEAIEAGATGKIFEAEDSTHRVEIWFDA